MEYFNNISKENENIGLYLKYIVLGKVYSLKMMDTGRKETTLRLNFFCSDVSSTGKDKSREAIEELINKINDKRFLFKPLSFDKSVDVNDASLIGTKRKVNKEYVPIFGKFYNYDIMCFPECSSLFDKSEFKKTMIQTLQGALDQPGYISKSLAEIEIKYDTDTAIIMFSIPFKAMNTYLLDSGFFQRFLIYLGNKDYIDIENISKNLSGDIVTNKSSEDKSEELKEFVDRIEETWRQQPAGYAKFSKECLKKLDEFENIYLNYRIFFNDDGDRIKFASFKPRTSKNLLRMSIINSIYNFHREVQPDDFNEPLELMKWHFESIKKLIIKSHLKDKDKSFILGRERKLYNKERVRSLIKEHKGNQTELYHKICKSENVSIVTAIKIYKEVI